MSFTDDSWEDPRFAEFKAAREGPHVYDFDLAYKLVEKQAKGKPLTSAERRYLRGFLDSTVCNKFFCRLNINFRNNSPCWMRGAPTDEQCSRCEEHFANQQVIHNWAEFRDQLKQLVEGTLPENTAVGLYSQQGADFVEFEWRPLKDPTNFNGLIGGYSPGVQVHLSSPLEKVFEVCLPSLSKTFKGGCSLDCDNCPARALFDTSRDILITGNNSVVLHLEHLSPSLQENLGVLAHAALYSTPKEHPSDGSHEPDRGR